MDYNKLDYSLELKKGVDLDGNLQNIGDDKMTPTTDQSPDASNILPCTTLTLTPLINSLSDRRLLAGILREQDGGSLQFRTALYSWARSLEPRDIGGLGTRYFRGCNTDTYMFKIAEATDLMRRSLLDISKPRPAGYNTPIVEIEDVPKKADEVVPRLIELLNEAADKRKRDYGAEESVQELRALAVSAYDLFTYFALSKAGTWHRQFPYGKIERQVVDNKLAKKLVAHGFSLRKEYAEVVGEGFLKIVAYNEDLKTLQTHRDPAPGETLDLFPPPSLDQFIVLHRPQMELIARISDSRQMKKPLASPQ